MRAAQGSLAVVALNWLLAHSQQEWVDLYGPRSEDSRTPEGEAERLAFVEGIGQDGAALLRALFDPTAPEWLHHVPAGEILRKVWVQNYHWIDETVRWRSSDNIPPASLSIGTPYDEEAHTSREEEHEMGRLESSSHGNV